MSTADKRKKSQPSPVTAHLTDRCYTGVSTVSQFGPLTRAIENAIMLQVGEINVGIEGERSARDNRPDLRVFVMEA